MKIREMYASIGADYEEVTGRLTDNEAFITKLVRKYAEDGNCERLQKAMQYKDYEDAFEAAHALKGLSSNLGFSKLYEVSSGLTEKLRAKDYDGVESLSEEVQAAHDAVVKAIAELE